MVAFLSLKAVYYRDNLVRLFINSNLCLYHYFYIQIDFLNLIYHQQKGQLYQLSIRSIISLTIFLFLLSAFSIAASKSVLLIVIVVFKYSSFEWSYVLLISFSLFKGVEVKHGGEGGGIFSCLEHFSKSSCICNSDGNF